MKAPMTVKRETESLFGCTYEYNANPEGITPKTATIYPAIYCRKPDIIIKFRFWLVDIWFYIAKTLAIGAE